MNFIELEKLADSVSNKIGEAVCIGVSYWHHRSGTKEKKYTFYRETGTRTIDFDSVLILKSHMENILNPSIDEGIDINDLADDGILRGAE